MPKLDGQREQKTLFYPIVFQWQNPMLILRGNSGEKGKNLGNDRQTDRVESECDPFLGEGRSGAISCRSSIAQLYVPVTLKLTTRFARIL